MRQGVLLYAMVLLLFSATGCFFLAAEGRVTYPVAPAYPTAYRMNHHPYYYGYEPVWSRGTGFVQSTGSYTSSGWELQQDGKLKRVWERQKGGVVPLFIPR